MTKWKKRMKIFTFCIMPELGYIQGLSTAQHRSCTCEYLARRTARENWHPDRDKLGLTP